MVEKTIDEQRLPREEVAARLQAIADELLTEGDVDVRVGNKEIRLHPSDEVGYEIGVRERSSVLRGSRESVTVRLDWKP
ncbi:amphi-Trp domain-containing protein [Halobium palmae]|uniref:Amphi-Trp domain-containing protein n=1 Tax=Halobium palmae TaxID=1776492 RepID=A0ABD5S4M8_9EURY